MKPRSFWLHEAKVAGIHYAIWLLLSVLMGWFYFEYVPIETFQKLSPYLAASAQNRGRYLVESVVMDALFLLPVHSTFWVYRALVLRNGRWGAIAWFVVYLGFYLIMTLFLTGVFVGYAQGINENYKMSQVEMASIAFFLWVYTVVFVGIRAFRFGRRQRAELERQKMQAELASLKAQVNPHFLFNTLNNLYGTALAGDSDRTAAGIEQLSGVMRHMVEESKRDTTPIQKEIRFLEDTIELHQMRLPRQENIRIKSVMEWDEQPTPDGRSVAIAPLLLVSFVENAFKYGISINDPCFVDIRLTVEQGVLRFTCRNTLLPQQRLESSTGTGIDNIQKRLQLVYPGRHMLTVGPQADAFVVDLTIRL